MKTTSHCPHYQAVEPPLWFNSTALKWLTIFYCRGSLPENVIYRHVGHFITLHFYSIKYRRDLTWYIQISCVKKKMICWCLFRKTAVVNRDASHAGRGFLFDSCLCLTMTQAMLHPRHDGFFFAGICSSCFTYSADKQMSMYVKCEIGPKFRKPSFFYFFWISKNPELMLTLPLRAP